MENPTNPEQPKEKRTLLELAANMREQEVRARNEVERNRQAAERIHREIEIELARPGSDATIVGVLEAQLGMYEFEAGKWEEIAQKASELAEGYERADRTMSN